MKNTLRKQIQFIFVISTLFFGCVHNLYAESVQSILNFEYQGNRINGILDIPLHANPKGIVLIIHGYGPTDAVARQYYASIRKAIVKAGYGTFMWDKMGCGDSEGEFDINQPVSDSADEAIAAIHMLRESNISGSKDIGLWGTSRAGWINPLIIQRQNDIRFWISVSGVDGLENWGYLLRENVLLHSKSVEYADMILSEWLAGKKIFNSGGSYDEYQAATANFRKDKFVRRWNNNEEVGRLGYFFAQKTADKENLDPETGLPIVIENYDKLLSNIDVPVLAIFGELDKNVDWQKTKRLYEQTFTQQGQLTVKSFPGTNHNMVLAKTGGFYEFQDNDMKWVYPDGYVESITDWLMALD